MTSIFLSYARKDDGEPYDPATSFVARLFRDLSAEGFDVWFDRKSMPSRGLTFSQEIRDAIAVRDRLVLVVGPAVKDSKYVEQEWKFALEADKVVTPILRRASDSDVPDEIDMLHHENFSSEEKYAF